MKTKKSTPPSPQEIAVIGMAGRFPGAANIEAFWANLAAGVESITLFTDQELEAAGVPAALLQDADYVKAKGHLQDTDMFDGDFFGYPPRQAERMDPQIRLLHECSWAALEEAGYVPDAYPGRVGVYFGALDNLEWIRSLGDQPEGDMDLFLLNYRDYISTRISFKLNLTGPSFTVLSACSTSLVAIHLACQALRQNECEAALAGGASIAFPEKNGYLFQEGLLLSSDGHCRTFDARADGTVFGDGVGVVVLKRLADALADGDPIRAVIRGSAVNNDGQERMGFTAPRIEGQRQVLSAALAAARATPDSIQMVEAHGTGTKLGDPIEFAALRQAYAGVNRGRIALGSVKTNIGHNNIAAGVAAFIKAVLSLENQMMPPSLNYQAPNPLIEFENSPFYVNNVLRPWPENGAPRRAAVSAFGFGGTNAHMILEAAPAPAPIPGSHARPQQLLPLSARTESAVQAAARNLANHFRLHPQTSLADAAHTLAHGRKVFTHRRTVVAANLAQAISALESADAAPRSEKKTSELIFMFPGQGAQYVGMAGELYREETLFRSTFDHCADILVSHLGMDIRDVIFCRGMSASEAGQRLTQTSLAQPAIFAVSFALAELLKSWGLRPKAFIGHSLGEFVAACLSGVFSLPDALFLVSKRGGLMQSVPPGAMLAVPLAETELSNWLDSRHAIAAVNAPELCVVSGDVPAIEELRQRLSEARIASQPLVTSHAFHSPMMEPALEPFRRLAEGIHLHPPTVPIMSTVTGTWADPNEISTIEYWARNMRQAVRFSQAITNLLADNDAALLEVGPGRALSNLCKMHLAQPRPVLASMRSAQETLSDQAFLLESVGKLWAAGVSLDWQAVQGSGPHRRVPLPGYPFERRRYRITRPQQPVRGGNWFHLTKNPNLSEWFSIPSWKRSLPFSLDLNGNATRMTWLLFADEHGVAANLAGRLETVGQDVIMVHPGERYLRTSDSHFLLRPAQRDDYELLFADILAQGRIPRHILHLWTITPAGTRAIPLSQAESFQELAFFSLLFLAQIIGNQNLSDEIRLTVITNQAFDVSGSDSIIADKATVLGPIKVIPQEFPAIDTCCIDIELGSAPFPIESADRILTEVVLNQAELVVAFRGAYRWVQIFEPLRLAPAPQNKTWLRPQGCYLISGGLGGLGQVLAEHLAASVQARLILTGRNALPPREMWAEFLERHADNPGVCQKIRHVQRLEALGAEVMLVAADVTDQTAMTAAVTEARARFGPIHGVIHAAGVPGEGVIPLKQVEAARHVLSPKIHGTLVLKEIFKESELDFLVLCSSIAAVLGGIGLVDYCAANAYLDAFATASHRHPVLAINWDMWGEVGMGLQTHMPQELQAWLEKELRDGITNREGVEAFDRILSYGKARNIIVSTRSLPARIDLWIKRELIKQKASMMEDENAEPGYQRPELASAFAAPEGEIEIRIAAIWSRLFGIGQVGRHDNFYELGGHSLLATTLVSKLKREFAGSISIRDIQDQPTVAGIAGLIGNRGNQP
jgi:acyl transferase domain-containing protein